MEMIRYRVRGVFDLDALLADHNFTTDIIREKAPAKADEKDFLSRPKNSWRKPVLIDAFRIGQSLSFAQEKGSR